MINILNSREATAEEIRWDKIKTIVEGKCPSCNVNDATEPHTCPYQADINNDEETLCTCCPDCQYECAMDI